MNTIFKIMLFSICLNFATGMMINILPDLGNNPTYTVFTGEDTNGQGFVSQMNSTITPTPDQSNTFFRLIDSLTIGILGKLLAMMNSYMYGFLNFLGILFHLSDALMWSMKGLLSVSYIIGAVWLWTGKNITQ